MSKKKRLEELYERCSNTISIYAPRDEMYDDLEEYYFINEESTQEEGIEVVKMPHGTNAVDLIQDLMSGADFSLTVPAPSNKDRDKRLVDVAEDFLHACIQQSERSQGQAFLGTAAWLTTMRGAIAGRVQAIPDWMDKGGESGEWSVGKRIPIILQFRDPRWVYPEFGLDGLDYIVERQTRTVGDIRRTYGSHVLKDHNPEDEVEWLEYWDNKEYAYWADGEPVKRGSGRGATGPWPHLYGGNPYAFVFARQTGHLKPEKRVRPLLESARSVIDKMNLLDSMAHTFISQYIGSAVLVKTDEGDFELDLKPGAVNYLRPEEQVEFLQAAKRQPDIDIERNKLSATLERSTFPGTMYGQDPGRVMAGYAISLLNESGQARIRPIIHAVEEFVSQLCENVLMVAENYIAPLIGGPIPFSVFINAETQTGDSYRAREELKFDAAALDGFYMVEARLGDLMPADEQSNIVLATRARTPDASGRPLLSDETILTRFNIVDNVAEERERIDRQAAWQSPEIQALVRAVAVAEIKADLMDQLKELGVDVEAVLAQIAAGEPQTAPKEQIQLGEGLPTSVMPPAMQGAGPPSMPPDVAEMMGMAQPGGM